jgi:cytochrome c-type biogenesis protein
MNNISYVLCFLEGIFTFVSPCILPMLPIYFLFLAGVTAEENINRRKLLFNAIGFVLGFSIIFVLLGSTATALGSFLKDNFDIFRKISGVIIVIFGLNFVGILKLGFLNIEKRFDYEYKEQRFLNSIVFGMVFGFGWTPCVGAFLGTALLMAANSQSLWQGILLLILYSAGLGVPFILTSIIFSSINDTFKKINKFSRMISAISGILLILAGILVYTNHLTL